MGDIAFLLNLYLGFTRPLKSTKIIATKYDPNDCTREILGKQ